MAKFLTDDGLYSYEETIKDRLALKQDTLVSGTNIKTINGTTLLGSGDITVGGGGTATNVKINGTTITSNNEADIITEGTYDATNNKIATMDDVPTKVSELSNDSGFTTNTGTITGITMNGSSKGTSGVVDLGTVITSHQDISGKVDKVTGKGLSTNDFTDAYKDDVDANTTARHTHSNKSVLDGITSTDVTNWNNKSDFSGDYDDLTNKPSIPDSTSDLTNDSGYITNSVNNLTNYTLSSSLSTVATSGSYTDLTNKPTIPDELADLSEDATHRLVTDTEKSTWNSKSDFSGSYNDLTNKPTIPTVPTTLSSFTDDLGSSPVHTHSQYLTSYTETDPVYSASAAAGITSSDITSWNSKSDFSGSYTDLTNKPTIPDSTSDLTNDSGFITNSVNDLTNYTTTTALNTLLASKMDWTELSSTTIRIWDLEPGAYKTTVAGRLYYNGASGSEQERIGTGALIFVAAHSTSYKSFYVLSAYTDTTTQVRYFNNYVGYTSETEGYCYETLCTGDVVDNLTSTSTSVPLSANQGKALKDLIDGLESSKQDALVSGTNIKTINSQSIVGSGNVDFYGTELPIGTEIDYDGTTVPSGWEEIDTYSTAEVKTSKKWIDDKPLYRKTISFTTTSNSYTFTTQSLDITDIDTIMLDSSHSYIKTASNLTYSWNALRPSGDGTLMTFNAVSWLRCSGSNVNYVVGSGLTSCSAIVTVEYTKTTD